MPEKLMPVTGLVSIVIPIEAESKDINDCADSIRDHTRMPYEIIFVSAARENMTWLNKLSEDTFLEAGKGSGVATCLNKGITAAKGEYIVLISSGGVVAEEWLSGMIECANSAPEAGIIGPVSNNINGPQRILNIGYDSLEQLDAFARSFREKNRHRRIPSRKIDSFCILFRRDLTDKIGLLDEGFYSEKFAVDDYCLRAALEGYNNIIAGDVFIHRSPSFTGDIVSHEHAMAKNRKLFNDKWSNLDVNTPIGKKALVLKAMEKAREHYHKEELDPAISTLLEGIAYVPDEKAIYHCIAEMLIAARLFKEAEDTINSMPKEFQKDAKALELSGYCKEGMALYTEAEELANRVLSINPNSASALNLKGRLALKKDDHEAAGNLFRKAIEKNPGLGEPYYSLGELKWILGQKDEALSFIEKGFILSPMMPDMAILYYSSAIETGNIERAEQLFRDAKALYPLNRKIAFLLIDLLIRQGKNEAAMTEIEGALITFGIDDGILQAALEVRYKVGAMRIEGTSKNSATISLCMIVKNEEKYLAKCLMSVKPVVDQMVVVDTGSSDRTKDIARAFGAEVYDFEWNDNFSDARNLSLSKANGDWIFILDADETISALDYRLFSETVNKRSSTPSAYIINTRNYIHSPNIDGWRANDGRYSSEEAGTGWNPTPKVRLFPNDSRIRFENPVHELVEPSLRRVGIEIIKSDIQVHHYGKLDIEKVESKGKKYFALGEKKLETNDSDAKSLFELAVQAGEIKEFQKAIELWQKLLKLDNPAAKGFHLIAYINMGNAYIGLGKLENAFEASEKAIELNPNSESAVINYGLSAVWLDEAGKAIPVLENLMLTRPDYPPAIGLLSVAYMMEGKMQTGVEYLDKIKRMGYDGASYLLDHANKLISAGKVDSAISLLEAAIESKNVNNEILSLLSECRKS